MEPNIPASWAPDTAASAALAQERPLEVRFTG